MRSDLITAGGLRPATLSARPGVHIHDIGEQPAWSDPALAMFFQQLRDMLGLPVDALARHLGTTVDVIGHLEAGRLRALPEQDEIDRVLAAYGRLVAMDLAPAARRIRSLTVAGDWRVDAVTLPHQRLPAESKAMGAVGRGQDRQGITFAAPAVPPVPAIPSTLSPSAGRVAEAGAPQRDATDAGPPAVTALQLWRRLPLRPVGAMLAATSVLVALMMMAAVLPSGARQVPGDKLASLVSWLSPTRQRTDADGLVWVEVGDPRSRKADKLPTAPRK